MTAVAAPAGFSMGRVINRAFSVLGHNFMLYLLLSALLVGVPTGVVSFLQTDSVFTASANDFFSAARIGLWAGGLLISIVCNAMLQGSVIHATVSDLAGRRTSFGESLAVGLRYFLPLLGISLIVGIGCFIGAVFFVVPGVLLALALCVAAPAEVMERSGVFGSLGRSVELTRNHRGAIFALVLGYFVVMWLIQMVVTAVVAGFSLASLAPNLRAAGPPGAGPQTLQTVMWIETGMGLVVATLLASLSSVGIASIYFELRQAKEGVGVDQLAAVFD